MKAIGIATAVLLGIGSGIGVFAAASHFRAAAQLQGGRVVDDQGRTWGENGIKRPIHDSAGVVIGYQIEYP